MAPRCQPVAFSSAERAAQAGADTPAVPCCGHRSVNRRFLTMPAPSYVHGASSTPLLGDTIGENLRRTVERVGDHEAGGSRQQGYRATDGALGDLTGAG